MSFDSDIQGKNTQLYPIVEIDGQFYSTNNVTIGDNYCKPILMNIPSIKESIGIESRKFKISNVSLQFNNFPFDGVRFSDQLSESSLINTEAIIYFRSPTESREVYKGIIRRISHDDEKVSVELEDLTEKKAHKDLPKDSLGSSNEIPSKYKGKEIPLCYGYVDRSPCVFDGKDVIIDSNDTTSIAPDELVDKDTGNSISIAISFEHLPPFFIGADGKYSYILESPREHLGTLDLVEGESDTEDILATSQVVGYKQWLPEFSTNKIILFPHPLIRANVVQCIDVSVPTIQLSTVSNNEDSENLFEGMGVDFDLTSSGTKTGLASFGVGLGSNSDFIRFRLTLGTSPQANFVNKKTIYVSLNGLLLPASGSGETVVFTPNPADTSDKEKTLVTLAPDWGLSFNHPEYMHDISDVGLAGYSLNPNAHLFGYPQYNGSSSNNLNNLTGDIDFSTSTQFQWDDGSALNWVNPPKSSARMFFYDHTGINTADDPTQNNQYIIEILHRYAGDITLIDSLLTEIDSMSMSGKINSASFKTLVDIEFGDKDFFVGTRGRKNENNPNLSPDEFFENPIDIIYDLVVSELGHDAIDEAEYLEAKKAHKYVDSNNLVQDWKFGFTINKKINSKKLIEDIAKSTKCFPKFKNDGTFGFNTIKDTYTFSDADANGVEHYNEYANADLIKESEVISYSFKKTKPEQIYKKVTVSYKKDYSDNSYLETASSIDLGSDEYYGIEDSVDAHLELESDYIRHGGTANQLANFLLEQYKNDHLIFNLKLPLQYIDLEIGDLVKFETLFNGVTAYGIDYTSQAMVNEQIRLPLFMVTSTQKSLDSISIECMQLHHLNGNVDIIGYDYDAHPTISVSGGNITATVGDTFTIPTATASDNEDGDIEVTSSWSSTAYDVLQFLPSNQAEAIAFGNAQLTFSATDSDNNTTTRTINVTITPAMGAGEVAEIQGFRSSGINHEHYGVSPTTIDWNVEGYGLDNIFWFLFYNESNIIDPEGVGSPPNIFQDDTAPPNFYYPYLIQGGSGYNQSSPYIRKVVQVSGLPNFEDDGLYFLAATYTPAEHMDMSSWNTLGAGQQISVLLNHWCMFQKITMTKNIYNYNTNSIDSTEGISTYPTHEEGVWFTDPVVDNDHVMGADIFQRNPGFPDGYGGFDDFQEYVAPDDPIMVGGEGEVYDFVGGIHSNQISSIRLTSLPLAPIVGNLGDSNVDGFLNVLDIVGTVNWLLGTGDLTEAGIIAADSNQDGSWNVLDIVTTVNDIMGTDY
jgi:hypothetical protein